MDDDDGVHNTSGVLCANIDPQRDRPLHQDRSTPRA